MSENKPPEALGSGHWGFEEELSRTQPVGPQKFTKRPVTIEAWQLTNDLYEAVEIAKWCGGHVITDRRGNIILQVETLEGAMTARLGDWIIKGVQGEFYPCRPDIFEQTYVKGEGE